MNEDYKELLSLLDLKDIKLLDSHERLVAISDSYNEENVNVNTEQMIPVNDPVFEEDCMRVHPKYVFTFSVGDVIYFKCEYILLASFYCKNPERVKELLKIEEVKKRKEVTVTSKDDSKTYTISFGSKLKVKSYKNFGSLFSFIFLLLI